MNKTAMTFPNVLTAFPNRSYVTKKRLEIMFGSLRFGYFTYASSFGCWCYAYYFRPSGRLC